MGERVRESKKEKGEKVRTFAVRPRQTDRKHSWADRVGGSRKLPNSFFLLSTSFSLSPPHSFSLYLIPSLVFYLEKNITRKRNVRRWEREKKRERRKESAYSYLPLFHSVFPCYIFRELSLFTQTSFSLRFFYRSQRMTASDGQWEGERKRERERGEERERGVEACQRGASIHHQPRAGEYWRRLAPAPHPSLPPPLSLSFSQPSWNPPLIHSLSHIHQQPHYSLPLSANISAF